nr:hypothetical protein [Tanacetum cinerariifolium]
MADENIPAPTPTRFDDQILPFVAWVPIRKSKFVLDHQRKQKNPIFQISVDILQNTNFFRAFTASALLDETRFVLDVNLLSDALEITSIDQAYQFVSPSSGDAIMDFLNQLRPRYPVLQILWEYYPKYLEMDAHKPRQPTDVTDEESVKKKKVSPTDKSKKPALAKQMKHVKEKSTKPTPSTKASKAIREPALGVTQSLSVVEGKRKAIVTNEGCTITPRTTTTKEENPTKKDRKDKPHVIPYCQFTKLIICHLGRIHNFHQRSTSPFHLAEKDLRLGNLKFIPKGEDNEVFRMPIPNELISNNIRNASYYNAYLEMDDASANIVHESLSHADAKTGADTDKTNSGEEKIADLDQGQAGSSLDKTLESRPLPEQEFIEEDQARLDPGVSRVALSGPNPEPTHEEFMANVYLDVCGNLKLPADKHVSLEEPLSSSGTLSSMNNLDDAYTFGDQFLDNKSTEDDSGKLNIDLEVVYMVTVPIHQASSLVPPLSTPIIDFYPPKPVPATTQAPIFTATTTNTTTTLPLPPPPPQ